jgi:hypothetical protein
MPSKAAAAHAATLESADGAAETWIVAPELLGQFLVAMDDAVAALDPSLRRVARPPLARELERS